MKTVQVPETLEEFREFFKSLELREASISDDAKIYSRILGWELKKDGRQVMFAPSLMAAYKKLFRDQLYDR